jgi:predicted 3-demethylubiquinone-9 3-methyltransferase (glyoxalase superfamily)
VNLVYAFYTQVNTNSGVTLLTHAAYQKQKKKMGLVQKRQTLFGTVVMAKDTSWLKLP